MPRWGQSHSGLPAGSSIAGLQYDVSRLRPCCACSVRSVGLAVRKFTMTRTWWADALAPWLCARLAPWLSALVLALSVIGKGYAHMTGLNLSTHWWDDRAVDIVLILLEGLMLAWIVSGRQRTACRWACILLFGLFAAVTLTIAATRSGSCGCFGRLHLPPLLIGMVDALLLVAWLAATPPPTPRPWQAVLATAGATSIACAVAMSVGAVFWVGSQALPSELRQPVGLPVLPVQILHGTWTVVVYRDDCPHCREVFAEWTTAARQGVAHGVQRWAFADQALTGDTTDSDLYRAADLPEGIPLLAGQAFAADTLPLGVVIEDGRIMATFTRPWLRPP